MCRTFCRKGTAWAAQVPILASFGHSGESRQGDVINLIYLRDPTGDGDEVFGMPIEFLSK